MVEDVVKISSGKAVASPARKRLATRDFGIPLHKEITPQRGKCDNVTFHRFKR